MSSRLNPAPFYKWVLFVTDVFGFFISFQLAYFFRFDTAVPYTLLFKLIPCAGLTLMVMYIFDIYKLENRMDFFRDLLRVLISILVAGAFLVIGTYLVGIKEFSGIIGRGVLLGALVVYVLWSTFSRVLIHSRVKRLEKKMRWLFIGNPEYVPSFLTDYEKSVKDAHLVCLMSSLCEKNHLKMNKKNFKKDDVAEEKENLKDLSNLFNKYLKGNWKDAEDWLKQDWQAIILAVGDIIPDHLVQQLMEKRFQGTRIYDLSEFYEIIWKKIPIFYLQQTWFALSQGFHLLHHPIGLRIKRLGDILCACLLLIVALPVMAVSSIILLVTCGRPIIYTQIRKGLNGKEFTIYKFRSMKRDAEKNGAQWAQENDKRVTSWGRLMRVSRIDELPQIWNIIKGDMSFIGPRPERPEFTTNLATKIPFYDFRHLVRPGLSGWAQVMYPYGSTVEDAKEKLQYELFYIKNYSLILDCIVLLKTFRVVLGRRGR